MRASDQGAHTAPLSSSDLSELRAAAAQPGGLSFSPVEDPTGERLQRLDSLNRRRLLRFGGVRTQENRPCEVIHALSESGRRACRLH